MALAARCPRAASVRTRSREIGGLRCLAALPIATTYTEMPPAVARYAALRAARHSKYRKPYGEIGIASLIMAILTQSNKAEVAINIAIGRATTSQEPAPEPADRIRPH